MHPNPAFRKAAETLNLEFARARGFGMITAGGPEGPLVSHVPFLLGEGEAEMHLVRSNPLARALAAGPLPALLAVTGPDGYVSPDWYGMDDQVPTWNYVAVHLRGTLRLADPETLRGHLDRVSARMEGDLPKKPWTSDKMSEGAMERLMRGIVPALLAVERVDGTWKLNQNKDESARLGAAGRIEGSHGSELARLAALMREPPA